MGPVKLEVFSGSRPLDLEEQVNGWFAENNNIEIVHIGTSSAMAAYGGNDPNFFETTTICIFYRR